MNDQTRFIGRNLSKMVKDSLIKFWAISMGLSLRHIGLMILLLLVWMFPASRAQIFVHELGHVLSATLAGGYSLGVILEPLPRMPAGRAPSQVQLHGTWANCIHDLSGTSAALLLGLILLFVNSRLPRESMLRLFVGLCAGVSFLEFVWYPLYSYYGGWGDFSDWPKLLAPWGKWFMPFLYLCCFPLGYAVGGWFFRTLDAWLPATSIPERIIQALLSVGVLYAVGIALYIIRFGINAAVPGIHLLTGLGSLLALYRAPLVPSAPPLRISIWAFMVPLSLVVIIEGSLIANDGYIPMPIPSSFLPPSSLVHYTDKKLVALPSYISIDIDEEDNVYCLSTEEHAIYQYARREDRLQKIWQADPDLYLHCLKHHNQRLILSASENTGTTTSRSCLVSLDLGTMHLETLLADAPKLHIGFDVDQRGDIYFAQDDKLMRLSAGATTPVMIRDHVPKIMWIRVGQSSWIYLFLLPPTWPESRQCSLVRVSKDGETMEKLRSDLDYSWGLDCDREGNIILAYGLPMPIMQLSAPDYRPTGLGGNGGLHPRLTSRNEIIYSTMRNRKGQLRILSPESK